MSSIAPFNPTNSFLPAPHAPEVLMQRKTLNGPQPLNPIEQSQRFAFLTWMQEEHDKLVLSANNPQAPSVLPPEDLNNRLTDLKRAWDVATGNFAPSTAAYKEAFLKKVDLYLAKQKANLWNMPDSANNSIASYWSQYE
jgi:hypothetical protein